MGFVRVTGVEGTATEKELACEDLKVKLSAEISALAGQTVEEVSTVPLGRIVKFCVWEALQNVPKFSVAFSSCCRNFCWRKDPLNRQNIFARQTIIPLNGCRHYPT